jgi:hypothetical protein
MFAITKSGKASKVPIGAPGGVLRFRHNKSDRLSSLGYGMPKGGYAFVLAYKRRRIDEVSHS